MSIIREFQEFAVKGNMVDMAVGIIIGAAFGKVVTSLVNDIVMPPIGMLIGGVNFRELAITMREAVIQDGVEVAAAVQIKYGAFINNLIDFFIIALAVFIVVKVINTLRRQAEARMKRGEDPVPPA